VATGHKNPEPVSRRQESTDGVLRTTSVSPGYVQTELVHYTDDPEQPEREETPAKGTFTLPPSLSSLRIIAHCRKCAMCQVGAGPVRWGTGPPCRIQPTVTVTAAVWSAPAVWNWMNSRH